MTDDEREKVIADAQREARAYAARRRENATPLDLQLDAKDLRKDYPTARAQLRAVALDDAGCAPSRPEKAGRTEIASRVEAYRSRTPEKELQRAAEYSAQEAVGSLQGREVSVLSPGAIKDNPAAMRKEAKLARAIWDDPRIDAHDDQRCAIRDSAAVLERAADRSERKGVDKDDLEARRSALRARLNRSFAARTRSRDDRER